MSDSQSPSQPNSTWFQMDKSQTTSQVTPNSSQAQVQAPAFNGMQVPLGVQNEQSVQNTQGQAVSPILPNQAKMPQTQQPNATAPYQATPAQQQVTAPAPFAPMAQPFMGQPTLTPEMQQQLMLAQQMQYQANWLQLHYQQWLMGRIQYLSQLWQQPESALWSNPQIQLQLQQEYRNTFDANDLYRQASLAVQAMGMFQGNPFGMGGMVSAFPVPSAPLANVATTTTSQVPPVQSATIATQSPQSSSASQDSQLSQTPQVSQDNQATVSPVAATQDNAVTSGAVTTTTTSSSSALNSPNLYHPSDTSNTTHLSDTSNSAEHLDCAGDDADSRVYSEPLGALELSKAETAYSQSGNSAETGVNDSDRVTATTITNAETSDTSHQGDSRSAKSKSTTTASTDTTTTIPSAPKDSSKKVSSTSKAKANANTKTKQDHSQVKNAESIETKIEGEDEGISEQQAEMSKLALELERSRQQISKQDINAPYVDLPFFKEQEAKLKMQAEALQARSLNSTQVRKVIELFERDDGLFSEANLFLRYIRDERRLSPATVNTYKSILLRSIVILEKVLPHPPAVPKSNDVAQSNTNAPHGTDNNKDVGQDEDPKVVAAKYRSLLKRSYDGDLVLQIGTDEALYYEKWGQIELSTFKSLHRELNFGVKHQRRASASVAQNLHALSSFFNFLVLRGHMVTTPMEYLQAPKVKNALPRVLSEREVGLMLDTKSPLTPQDYRDLAMIELMYASGLRVAELVSLDLGDIDFDMREVRVLGKGNKERVVPMGSAAIKALQAYLLVRHNFEPAPHEKALFLNHLGTRISTRSVQMKVKAAARDANLEGKVTPHKLRHAFATQLLNNGVNLRMVQEMLGHANLATTQIYTHLDLKRLQDVYSKAHPLASATHSKKEREELDKQRDKTLAELDSVLEVFDPDDDKPI